MNKPVLTILTLLSAILLTSMSSSFSLNHGTLKETQGESTDISVRIEITTLGPVQKGQDVGLTVYVRNNGPNDARVDYQRTTWDPRNIGWGHGINVDIPAGETYVDHFNFYTWYTGQYFIEAKAHPMDIPDNNPKNNRDTAMVNAIEKTTLII